MEESSVMRSLTERFRSCSEILTAIGDETRQHIIVEMISIGKCNGVRVGEITEKTNLSRPAISRHLKIMKDAGLVKVRREGTKSYYFFDPEPKVFEELIQTLQLAISISQSLPNRQDNE